MSMKNEFNKRADTLYKYVVSLEAKVTADQYADLYRKAMDRSKIFASYVNGWAVGTGAHGKGDFFACHTAAPLLNGKADVINGDTPAVTVIGTQSFMRRLQKEFGDQVAAIRREEKFNHEPTRQQNWKHPRKDNKTVGKGAHYLATPFGERLFGKDD